MVRKVGFSKIQLGRKCQTTVFETTEHYKIGVLRIFGGILCPSRHNIAKKGF